MKPQIIQSKVNTAKGEVDECLFEYLHAEMINYVLSKSPADSEQENLTRLEWMGFGVGYRIIERCTCELSRFKEEIDALKFICTDFWISLFQRQIDNLRTNHNGVYILQDNEFKLLKRVGIGKQYLKESPRLLTFTCGLLRGCLANLGIPSIIKAEVAHLPTCRFNVQVLGIK